MVEVKLQVPSSAHVVTSRQGRPWVSLNKTGMSPFIIMIHMHLVKWYAKISVYHSVSMRTWRKTSSRFTILTWPLLDPIMRVSPHWKSFSFLELSNSNPLSSMPQHILISFPFQITPPRTPQSWRPSSESSLSNVQGAAANTAILPNTMIFSPLFVQISLGLPAGLENHGFIQSVIKTTFHRSDDLPWLLRGLVYITSLFAVPFSENHYDRQTWRC